MPEQNIHDFFVPKELKFISSKAFKNGFMWDVEKLRRAFEICPKCGSKTNVRCGKATSVVREAPLRNQPLWLRINKHRYYCKSCRKPFTESVDCVWPRRKTTHQDLQTLSL